jgi:hypothetical protein
MWCRWLSSDKAGYLDPESINGINLYMYCGNNPLMIIDSSGQLPKWAAWLISGVLVIGGLTLSILTAGIAAGGLVGALATAGGILGNAMVAAGVSSMIGGYVNEAKNGSFEAGYWGGMVTGAITGLGAGVGGVLYGLVTQAANGAALGYFAFSMASSFTGGFLGNIAGSLVVSSIDHTRINWGDVLMHSMVLGSLNILAGIGYDMSSAVGSIAKTGASIDTKIAARVLALMIASGTEGSYDLLSYLIGKFF